MHQIGVGVLGPVFRTYDPTEDRLVAVKAFHLDMTPEQARTLVEALEHLVGVGLSHPGLATPLAAGLEEGVPYLAQEYVAAESLDVAMRHYSPAQSETAMLFIGQMADAIDAAHESGIVHGALHLRDVFVTPDESHLTGFGVVTALEEIGLAGPIRRPYTAPEVITRRPWGGASDRFALASISYESLTGRRAAGTGAQVTERLRSVVDAADPEQLQDVFAMALADEPDDRYSSGARFVAALAAAMGDLPTDVGPASRAATSELEPLDLLAGLDLHAAESPVTDVLDELGSRERSPGSKDSDAASSERLSFEAPDLPRDDPSLFEDDVSPAGSAVPESDPGSESDLVRTRAAAGAAEATDAGFETNTAGDDIAEGDEVDEVDPASEAEDAWVGLPEPDEAAEPSEIFAGAAEDEEGGAGGLYVDHPPVGPQQSRPWWRRPGAVVALVLAVGGLAYVVGAGLVPNDAPIDLVLGVDGDGLSNTANREFSEGVVGAETTVAVPGTTGGTRSTPLGTASEGTTPEVGIAVEDGVALPGRTDRDVSEGGVALPRPPPAAPLSPSSPETARPPALGGGLETTLGIDPVASDAQQELLSPASSTGWILVRTEPPSATVLLNGVRRGQTPLSLRDVPFGQHQVEVSRPGFETVRRVVTVGASSAVLPVGIELMPTDRQTETERAGAETGALVFQSRPTGARVIVDGSLAGRTPIEVEVSAGRHDIRIEGDGYAQWVTTVDVTAAERVSVNASLERLSR